MNNYMYFDTHCDTLTRIYSGGMNLCNKECMVSLEKISGYSGYGQVFAVFNNGTLNRCDMLSHFYFLKEQCEMYAGKAGFVVSTEEIDNNIKCGRASAVLSVEAVGNQPDFDINCIREYSDHGVRMMSLCWNDDNILCGGIEKNTSGLTRLGENVLSAMEECKIILDVSHMSDKSFYEAFEHYSLPIAASHSNSRTVTKNMRNITDEQFSLIKSRGGVCGINFYPPFLGNDGVTSAIRHIEHFMSLGGENNICIGADFDGIDVTSPELSDSSCVSKLFDELSRLNYKDSTISKIAFANFYNLLTNFEI